MKNLDVIVEHIYHSGFTVETKNHFLVFDYYKGDIELKDKKIYVFSTHGHKDHFNPEILDWEKDHDIEYIFSDDIDSLKKENIHYIGHYQSLNLDDLEIKTYSSTDLGISILVRVDGISIFFAGDLNWWYWEDDDDEEKISMEKAFKIKVERIVGQDIDIGFFPVDPRLEDYYHLGGEYFINKTHPKYFFPMHFGDKFDTSQRFINKIGDIPTKILDVDKRNQIFKL
ncbi:MAG TPA: hypothetical protein VK087_06570 [Tissierellaceae bacterium]|nr:hypothetical protein [Tissierellaceae bacterium]